MIVVAVCHLLDVVVVVAVVADVLPVADTVADSGVGTGNWRDSLSLDLDSCQRLRRIGDGAVACPDHSVPVWKSDSHAMFMVLGCANGTPSRHPAQDALLPESGEATGNDGGGWRRAWIALARGQPLNRPCGAGRTTPRAG